VKTKADNKKQKVALGKSVIGRWVSVNHRGRTLEGTVMDAVAGTNKAKRVRVQDGAWRGKVLMPGEYQVMEFLD
jgi:hypothetical protein